ncbi:MAG: NAD-dependent epimerase/dehydratase family protein [bacterium]|nr:NAD-dependent epimerase/dehydratase family protein [bacterium]
MPKKEIILVTGAAGFIGSHLVDVLVAKGYRVRCFVRKKDNLEFLPNKNIEIFYGDITDKRSILPAIKGVDIVYHLAAKTDFAGKNWNEYYRPNVLGTQNLIDLAVKEKVRSFIFFSTIRVIGLRDCKQPVNELAVYNPLNFYDRSKYEAEKKLFEAYHELKLPITIIRPTSVYGPRDRGTYYSFFKAIAAGKFFLIGSGKNLVSFVNVKNVVEAAILAKDSLKAVGQVYFINDDRAYTMKEFSSQIARAFGKQLPRLRLPIVSAYVVSYFLSGCARVLGFKPILTPERVKNLTLNYVFDIKKAKRDLGYKPKIGLVEGVQETAQWYKKHDWI